MYGKVILGFLGSAVAVVAAAAAGDPVAVVPEVETAVHQADAIASPSAFSLPPLVPALLRPVGNPPQKAPTDTSGESVSAAAEIDPPVPRSLDHYHHHGHHHGGYYYSPGYYSGYGGYGGYRSVGYGYGYPYYSYGYGYTGYPVYGGYVPVGW